MSKTGTYKYDPKTKTVVKISDRIPKCLPTEATVLRGPYFDPHLGCEIRSRRQKAEVMKRQEVAEVGSGRASDFVRHRSPKFHWPEAWNFIDG
jgi:hypothetical protein